MYNLLSSPAVSKLATELHEAPAHLPCELGLYEICNIILGPLDRIFENNANWRVEKYSFVVKTFEMLEIDHVQVYNNSINKMEN